MAEIVSLNLRLILMILELIPRSSNVLNAIVEVDLADSTVWNRFCIDGCMKVQGPTSVLFA